MKTCSSRQLKAALVISTVLSLSGCQSAEDRQSWKKNEVPQTQSQHDLTTCTYEAESATATIGSGGHPKTTSDAIGNGIADGIESGMEQSELISRCMQARGYHQ